MRKSKLKKLIIFNIIFFLFSYNFFFVIPSKSKLDSANLINASVTLTNSRLSYRAGVATGAANSSNVTIDSSGNPDNNTNHLFPNDVVCFAGANLDGCYEQKTYTVANIINSTNFNFSPPLGGNPLGANDLVISTQSAIHTITFTTVNTIPANGDILITIPAVNVNGQTNDGFPDTANSVSANGFDLNGITTSDISISTTGCPNNWTIAAVTAGNATNDHTIRIDRTNNSCVSGSTITITVGNNNTKKLINPAPVLSGHTQGVADVYTINIKTRDGSDNTLDEANVKVAVVEGVLVSAIVEETLSLTIAGVNSNTTACNQTTDVTTTATSVPWGVIANFGQFREAAQSVTVSTNASSGYNVTIQENDQMGKDGKICTGPYAGENQQCIQDTTCDNSCSHTDSDEWTSTSKYGLGYSLQNVNGTDASFLFNQAGRQFSAKQIPDQESQSPYPKEEPQIIMSSTTPVASSQVYVCYRLNVSATQPAGYYFNIVRYTASAKF